MCEPAPTKTRPRRLPRRAPLCTHHCTAHDRAASACARSRRPRPSPKTSCTPTRRSSTPQRGATRLRRLRLPTHTSAHARARAAATNRNRLEGNRPPMWNAKDLDVLRCKSYERPLLDMLTVMESPSVIEKRTLPGRGEELPAAPAGAACPNISLQGGHNAALLLRQGQASKRMCPRATWATNEKTTSKPHGHPLLFCCD